MSAGPVLHLCSDFARQRLYPQLMAALHDAGVDQSVYVPVRTAAEAMSAGPPRPDIRYHARHVLRPMHRVLFRHKLSVVTADLSLVEDPTRFAIVHAHFLFSDGGVALRLHERHGVPYVAAIRNTDLNFFMRFRPDLRFLMHHIMAAASGLVFLSPAYREQFLARLPRSLAQAAARKSLVVPNGLAPSWLQPPLAPPAATPGAPLRVLYVGDFTSNKNVPRLLKAVAQVALERPVRLSLVGGGGEAQGEIQAMLASARFPFARYLGAVSEAEYLRELYRSHDLFAMPSLLETFGMVYVEALSQGLPILLSKGQGVDGYFPDDSVAEAVDPRSVDDIARGILTLASRSAAQRQNCIQAARVFAWPTIASRYRLLYESVIRTGRAQ